MKQRRDIKSLSAGLRTRLEREILGPLLSLEDAAGAKTYSAVIAEKVFKDFRKINDGIWEELYKERLINEQAKAAGREEGFSKKTRTHLK